MWTTENRCRYDRSHLRYESDLTDEEWAQIEPQIPPAKRGGNKRTVNIREVVNGLMYILSTGCQWGALPRDLPPKSTVHDYFDRWRYDRTLERIHHALHVKCREQMGREASPTAAVVDRWGVAARHRHLKGISQDACRGIAMAVDAQEEVRHGALRWFGCFRSAHEHLYC